MNPSDSDSHEAAVPFGIWNSGMVVQTPCDSESLTRFIMQPVRLVTNAWTLRAALVVCGRATAAEADAALRAGTATVPATRTAAAVLRMEMLISCSPLDSRRPAGLPSV